MVAHILSATTNQDLFLYIVTPTPDKHPKAGPCEPSFQKGTLKKAPVYTDSLSATFGIEHGGGRCSHIGLQGTRVHTMQDKPATEPPFNCFSPGGQF